LNREVEISSGGFNKPGERTDIHIDAVAKQGRRDELNRVKVIIEVKGCWNRQLKTAMQEQLLDRYLQSNDCRHGLYFVGWFPQDNWDKNDYRRGNAPKSLAEVRSNLTTQAASLSAGGVRVEAFVLDGSLA